METHCELSGNLGQRAFRLWRIIAAIGFVGLQFLTSGAGRAQDERALVDAWQRGAANYGYTRSTEPVEIELWNPKTAIRLTIEKAYLTFKPSWRGGRREFVTLEAALPDLRPAILDPREMVPAEDRIFLTLTASIPGGTTNFVKRDIGRLQKSSQDEKFAWYHEKNVFDSGGVPHVKLDDEEFAVPLEQVDDPRVLFNCLPSAPDRKAGCIAYTEIVATDTGSIGLNYQIRRSELSRWRDIDGAVRKLVTSFVTATPSKN